MKDIIRADYLPEEDSGASLGEASCVSANVWLPINCLKNPDALLRAARFSYVNPKTGKELCISIAKRVGEHLVIAREFLSKDAIDAVTDTIHKPTFKFSEFGFVDKIEPRNAEQALAWDAFNDSSGGVLNLACGKGKTVLALKKIASRGYHAVVLVNNAGLLEQWIDRAKEFLGLTDDEIGIVQGAKEDWDKPLVIAMIHTLAKRAASGKVLLPTRLKFGTIVFDEVHHLSAATFLRTAGLFYGERYGLTATPKREDGLEPVYYAHVGEIFFTDLKGEQEAKVFFKELPTKVDLANKEITDVRGEFCTGKFYKYLATDTARNLRILDEVAKALKKGRKVLALGHSVEHPKELIRLSKLDPVIKRHSCGQVSGETSGKLRTEIIRNSDVTFATFQVAKEGLDVAELDTVFFLTPFKAWGSLQQGKGRVERTHEGKKDPLVIIFNDCNVPPARAMCRSLMRSLRANGFSFKEI
jgi:superfamily II DNA or RNA helicase